MVLFPTGVNIPVKSNVALVILNPPPVALLVIWSKAVLDTILGMSNFNVPLSATVEAFAISVFPTPEAPPGEITLVAEVVTAAKVFKFVAVPVLTVPLFVKAELAADKQVASYKVIAVYVILVSPVPDVLVRVPDAGVVPPDRAGRLAVAALRPVERRLAARASQLPLLR